MRAVRDLDTGAAGKKGVFTSPKWDILRIETGQLLFLN